MKIYSDVPMNSDYMTDELSDETSDEENGDLLGASAE